MAVPEQGPSATKLVNMPWALAFQMAAARSKAARMTIPYFPNDLLEDEAHPTATEEAVAAVGSSPVVVVVHPRDVSNQVSLSRHGVLEQQDLDGNRASRYGPKSVPPSARGHSPCQIPSPSVSTYFTASDDSSDGSSTSTPPNKAGSNGPPSPASAAVEGDGEASDKGWSGFDLGLFGCDAALLGVICAEIKDTMAILGTAEKVVFFVALGVAGASMGIGLSTAGYPIVPISRCRRLSACCARLCTVTSTALFITRNSCFSGRIGCIAGAASAGVVASAMTALWAFEKRWCSTSVEEAVSGLWSSLRGGQSPPAESNRVHNVV